ncbi:hypothetical protein C8J56DRAFT_927516 [Mycena floridula]|nr:hypothetical protein C8J56DRAFT_927516 [Mycena floridula]
MNRFRSWLPLIFTIPTAMDSYLTPGFNYRSTKLLYQQGGRPDEILEETLGAVMQSTGVTLDQVKVLFRTMSTINGGADFEDDGASTRFRRQLVRAVMLATGDLTLNYSEVMRLYKVLLDTRHGAGGNWWTENEKISLIRLLADWGYDNYSEIAQTLDRSDRGVQIFIQRSTLWWIAEDVARIEILEAHYQDFVSNTPNLSNFDHILRRFHRSPEFRRSVLKRIPSIQDAERAARYKARNRAKRAAAKASA